MAAPSDDLRKLRMDCWFCRGALLLVALNALNRFLKAGGATQAAFGMVMREVELRVGAAAETTVSDSVTVGALAAAAAALVVVSVGS